MSHFKDYLGDVPVQLVAITKQITSDWSDNLNLLEHLDDLIQNANRMDVALSLLDLFDVIEMCSLPSMVPSQKSEFCWHLYNRYFKLLARIIMKFANGNQFNEATDYLISKYSYETLRRSYVISTGGSIIFNKIKRDLEKDLQKLGLDDMSNKIHEIRVSSLKYSKKSNVLIDTKT